MNGMGLLAGYTQILSNAISNEWEKEASQEQYDRQIGLSAVNKANALQLWKDTNFAEQRRQMEKAGLSVGLMYGKGGGMGTASASPGQIQKRNVVPLDVNSAMQIQMQAQQLKLQQQQIEANVKNTQADTELKKQELERKSEGGVEYEQTQTATEKLKQETKNAELQAGILEAQKQIAEIEANVANHTQKDLIDQIKIVNDKLYGEAQSALTKANVDSTTREEQIQLIEQATIEQQVRIAGMKNNINLTDSQIAKIATEINMMKQQNMREWDKMTQTDKEIAVKQMLARIGQQQADFNTSAGAQIKQWTSIITDIFNAASK